MAMDSLTTRLDAMTPPDGQMDLLPPADQVAAEVPDVTLTENYPEFEPVAAGGNSLGKLMFKNIRKAPKRTERPMLMDNAESGKVGPYVVIDEAAPKADQILNDAPTAPASGKPSPSTKQKAAGVQETVFNLDMIDGPDALRQHMETTARAYGADKVKTISYKQIAEEAAKDGYDEKFIARILDPNNKTVASPEEAYKMYLTMVDASKRSFDLGEQVKAAKAAGTLNADLASQFTQALALEGALAQAVKGRQTDIARTLGVLSQVRRPSAMRGQQLDALMQEAGGIDNVYEIAKRYTALDTRGARAEYAAAGYTNDLKGWGTRFKDMAFSTYINGLLSLPITHAKNIVGNAFFGAYQIPERALGSVIGKTRNLFFGGEEAITMNEVYAQAIGYLQGMREGAVIAGKAFKSNQPTDAFSKIEATRYGRDPFDMDLGDGIIGKSMSNGFRYWGKFVTLPGRTLMAEDEFFKAVGYRMELNALATRESQKEYRRLLEAGADEKTATTQAAALHENILANPTPEIDEAAKSFARTITFTRELEQGLRPLQNLGQNPLIKIYVPFVKTPTNIAQEALARSPFAPVASSRFYEDFNAGGNRRDMALARVSLGSGIVFGVAGYALEGKMTGYGPMRAEDKKALEGTGWQQFSFVFNKGDLSLEMLQKFKAITSVSEGADKVYVSYAGLEPLSTLLAIGSTSGEYSMLSSNQADMEKMAMGATLGIYQYLAEQPMLQGVAEIHKAFTSKAKDGPTMIYNIMAQLTKQGTTFAILGSPAGAHSSLVAGIERLMNPEKSLVMEAVSPEEVGFISGAERGFWEGMNTYCSRNPMCSDKLPRQLDPLTGEVKKVGKGNWAELFNPFKTSEGNVSEPHAVLAEYKVPLYQPDKKIEGVELTAEQYGLWIEYATDDGKLGDRIVNMTESAVFQRGLADPNRGLRWAQEMIQNEISDAYSRAKQRLLREDQDLADKIKDLKKAQVDDGKYKW